MRRVNFQKSALYNLVRIFLFVYADCRLVAAYHIDHNCHNFIKPRLTVSFRDNVIVNVFLDYKKKYEGLGYEVFVDLPVTKDYNNDLQMYLSEQAANENDEILEM